MTVVYLVGTLLWSIPPSHGGFVFVAPSVLGLLLLVLLHEFGHCVACRRVGGEADRIVLLPWGGLALVRPPHSWKAHFAATAGGPAVHLLLVPVLGAAVVAVGMGDFLLFNPFKPLEAVGYAAAAGSSLEAAGRITLWWLHYINIVLLLFNVFLPMYPFDGGRLVQALLWSRLGYRRAQEIAVLIGFAGAMVLGLAALWLEQAMLVLIAAFGAWACWLERRRLRGEIDIAGDAAAMCSGYSVDPGSEAEPSRRELKRRERENREQAELDRILAKIARSGMDSLSRPERRLLRQMTERKRRE